MPFPADGPTTTGKVKALLKIGDAVDDAYIGDVVAAVNDLVESLPVAQALNTDPAPADWTGAPRIMQGATMLAARLFERRNSPNGVAAFGDGATAYVQRNDPDVAILLRIGPYSPPRVG